MLLPRFRTKAATTTLVCCWAAAVSFSPRRFYSTAALSTTTTASTVPLATMADGKVRMLDLASAAVACTVSASRKIRKIAEPLELTTPAATASGDAKNTREKEDGSFVTDADFAAQGIIFQSLKAVCPDIRIVGEESPEEMQQHMDPEFALDVNLLRRTRAELRMRYYKTIAPAGSAFPLATVSPDAAEDDDESEIPTVDSDNDPDETLIDISRVSCIIDPLDGTRSYARGEYDVVSILICLLVDDQPYFGVIGKPFGYTGLPKIRASGCCTIYGGPLIDGVYIAGGGPIVASPLVRDGPPELLPRAVISSSRSKGIVHDFCGIMGEKGLVSPDPMLISGAGEKSMRLILQRKNEAIWFFPKPGTSLWDVAAPDALLRSLGGKMTDKNGNPMDYSKPREEAENIQGLVACIDASLHEECIQLFKNWEYKEES
uniref:3'(2'),5'-bisphosphate nucleotidase 1 n=1 Tax=Amphora coffeiformis TaxID=265554 RepID=A0A7S3KYZ0_9STRA|mmetsp:Transcript_13474/g.27193  ORF Transcript_13474/g.27193 Transcript_13474/m.27193 type:complete len:432 (+) Transcript_13474:129-1424(+)